LYLQVL